MCAPRRAPRVRGGGRGGPRGRTVAEARRYPERDGNLVPHNALYNYARMQDVWLDC
jgi:hypothetical protein